MVCIDVAEEMEVDLRFISELKYVEFVYGLNMKGRKLDKKEKSQKGVIGFGDWYWCCCLK